MKLKHCLGSALLMLGLLGSQGAFANQDTVKQEVAAQLEGIEITVNVNQASAQEIADLLSGIGLNKANNIVAHREEHGPFTSLESLDDVKGIGPATLAKNEGRILF